MTTLIETEVKYDRVGSSEDECSESSGHYRNYDDDKNFEGHLAKLEGTEEDANSILLPLILETRARELGSRGTAPRSRRIRSRGAALRSSSSRWRNGGTCWLFGVLATVAITASWVWSSGNGANYMLLRLRRAASPSQSEGVTNPDEELITTPRPFLHELIADFNSSVTGNVSWLMDFAIIGHPKCSTSSHQAWLRSHPEILMHENEVHALTQGRPAEMTSLLHALPNLPHRKRGYKAPKDLMTPRALDNLRTYWPDTKLIVGVRHPVTWFESFYNFNKRQADLGLTNLGLHLGPAETMGVPAVAYFHAHLSLLGKTNVTDPEEMALLGDHGSLEPPVRMKNKVFLYESTQPYDLHNGRNAQYRRDLQSFLGLKEPLSPIHLRGETNGENYNYSSRNFHYDIDICEEKYARLRRQLVDVGTAAADWILMYFVPHPDVTVSSPDRFEELLRSWAHDPCKMPRNM